MNSIKILIVDDEVISRDLTGRCLKSSTLAAGMNDYLSKPVNRVIWQRFLPSGFDINVQSSSGVKATTSSMQAASSSTITSRSTPRAIPAEGGIKGSS